MPVSDEELKLRALAKTQLFVMDLRETDASPLLAAQLGSTNTRQPVVWRDAESELLVYPSQTRVKFAPGFVLVELTASSDQTGRAQLVFAYKIGATPNEASLTAVAESQPRGDATLATRWAEPATRLLWFALLRCGQVLLERRRSPEPLVVSGVYTLGKVLSFIATAPVGAGELRQYYAEVRTGDQPLDLSVLNRRYLGSVPLRRRVKR